MVTKKNASATSDAKTVTFDVSRDGADEFYRSRTWDDKGTIWLVIDPYGSVNPRGVLEGTLSDLLIDTNIRRLDLKAGKIIQLHAFSQQPVRINNDLLKEKGGTFEQMLPYLKEAIEQASQIVMATGALSRRYAAGEVRVSQILGEIEKLGKIDNVQWIIDPSTGLPSSPTHRAVRQEGDWVLEKGVDYKQIQ
jgi:hypothetical protein